MKQLSAPMRIYKRAGVTTSCTLIRAQREDGFIVGFTDLDADLLYDDGNGPVLYLASTGSTPSSIASSAGNAVDNNEFAGVMQKNNATAALLNSPIITEADIVAGLWDRAELAFYRVNYLDLSMGHEWLNGGYLGEVTTGTGAFQAEIRGFNQTLQQQMSLTVQSLCSARFCDAKCKLNAADWTHTGTVVSVGSNRVFVTDLPQPINFFKDGVITFQTGLNAGRGFEVKFFSGVPIYTTLTQVSMIVDRQVLVAIPDGAAFEGDLGVVDAALRTYSAADTPSSQSQYTPNAGVYAFNQADEGKTVTITYSVLSTLATTAGQVELQSELRRAVYAGDTFQIIAGCDKTIDTCRGKFANARNMRAFPFVPGRDALMAGVKG